jgi:hypothetical protein
MALEMKKNAKSAGALWPRMAKRSFAFTNARSAAIAPFR